MIRPLLLLLIATATATWAADTWPRDRMVYLSQVAEVRAATDKYHVPMGQFLGDALRYPDQITMDRYIKAHADEVAEDPAKIRNKLFAASSDIQRLPGEIAQWGGKYQVAARERRGDLMVIGATFTAKVLALGEAKAVYAGLGGDEKMRELMKK